MSQPAAPAKKFQLTLKTQEILICYRGIFKLAIRIENFDISFHGKWNTPDAKLRLLFFYFAELFKNLWQSKRNCCCLRIIHKTKEGGETGRKRKLEIHFVTAIRISCPNIWCHKNEIDIFGNSVVGNKFASFLLSCCLILSHSALQSHLFSSHSCCPLYLRISLPLADNGRFNIVRYARSFSLRRCSPLLQLPTLPILHADDSGSF